MIKETVGKVSSDLIIKSYDNTHNAEDQMREQLSDYDKNLYECAEKCKRAFSGDSYIVVLTKKERLMQNVIRNYFTGRQSCPTPEWDQVVYHYRRSSEDIIFLWSIPAKDICEWMMQNPWLLATEEKELYSFVTQFYDGTLLLKAKQLNKEIENG